MPGFPEPPFWGTLPRSSASDQRLVSTGHESRKTLRGFAHLLSICLDFSPSPPNEGVTPTICGTRLRDIAFAENSSGSSRKFIFQITTDLFPRGLIRLELTPGALCESSSEAGTSNPSGRKRSPPCLIVSSEHRSQPGSLIARIATRAGIVTQNLRGSPSINQTRHLELALS